MEQPDLPLIPYVRRSRKDEEVISIRDQVTEIYDWAERSGVTLTEAVIEPGVSGHTSWRERELGNVVERCKRGEAGGVIVAYHSRLSREKLSASVEVQEELEPFWLVVVRDNRVKAPGEKVGLVDVIRTHQANEEWEILKKNLKGGQHHTWVRGAYVSTRLPSGYVSPRIPVYDSLGNVKKTKAGPLEKGDHVEAIARAFSGRANGGSFIEVARVLTQAGVPTPSGKPWSVSGASTLVSNPLYKGELRCTCGCGESRFIKELAIVTPSMWERAQPAKLPPPSTRGKLTNGGRRDGGRFLLSGLIRCGECGSTMSYAAVKHGDKTYASYRCRGGLRCTSRTSISAPQVEPLVLETAMAEFTETEHRIGHEPDIEALAALEHERDEANQRLEGLVRLLEPTDPGAGERLATARAALVAAEVALLTESTAQVEYVPVEQVREMLQNASLDEKRRLLRLTLGKVTVRPEKGSPVERVTIYDKHGGIFTNTNEVVAYS